MKIFEKLTEVKKMLKTVIGYFKAKDNPKLAFAQKYYQMVPSFTEKYFQMVREGLTSYQRISRRYDERLAMSEESHPADAEMCMYDVFDFYELESAYKIDVSKEFSGFISDKEQEFLAAADMMASNSENYPAYMTELSAYPGTYHFILKRSERNRRMEVAKDERRNPSMATILNELGIDY